MDASECIRRKAEIAGFLEIDDELVAVSPVDCHSHLYSIAGRISIPCLPSGGYGLQQDENRKQPALEIPIRLDGTEIGSLCLSSRLLESGIKPDSASDNIKHSLLRLCSEDELVTTGFVGSGPALDCVVVFEAHFPALMKHHLSSALWGGFVLLQDAVSIERSTRACESSVIDVAELGVPRTTRHRLALQRSTESEVSADRFLHLYHFLELDYDHELVKRIKEIDIEDTSELNRLLSTGRDELDRLNLVMEGFSNHSSLESIFSFLPRHKDVAIKVFYEYGKDHNPLKDKDAFEHLFLTTPSINRESLHAKKEQYKLNTNFTSKDEVYRIMLVRLACYWVYRTRCCIAHNKIGEYHMRTPEDMQFVSDFAEPLAKLMISHRLGPNEAQG